MPNYTLVANSTFQPFTYQELMMPIERQNQYFEKLAEEYDKMSSQADVLEAMGSSDLDKGSNTYNRYKAYSDNLRKERDNLFANGLNFESRQRLSDLRRMYNTEIVPIQNAWQKREQEAQLQMKARMDAAARGIDIRFSRDAANSSLDSYMQNPNQTFQVINGQQITNEVANQFKGLASQVQSDGNGNYFIKGKPLSQIEYSIITQKGMDWNHYQDFINNPNDSRFANIRGIIENTLNAHGIKNFDENTYRDMFAYGAQGVAAGVGARDVQLHTDKAAEMALEDMYRQRAEERQLNKQIALEREKARLAAEAAGGGNGGVNEPKLIPTNTGIENAEEYEAKGLEDLQKLKGGKDGLKSSYFGTTIGKVNPMKIYQEYQKAYEDEPKTQKGTGYALPKEQIAERVKKKVLAKYAKYGVRNILTDRQYDALKGMGFNENSKFNSNRFSDYERGFNNLVRQKTAYDIPMADGSYKEMSDLMASNLINEKDVQAKVFEYDGWKKGKGVKNIKELGIDPSDPSKNAGILMIGYDPNHKGFVRVTVKGGKRFLVRPSILGILPSDLKNLEDTEFTDNVTGERRYATGKEIASGLSVYPNRWNQGRTSTSNDVY